MLPQKIWLPENVSGAFWQQFLGWFSSNFYSCILLQRPPPNLSTSLKLVAIFISSNFTATLANFGLYLWSSTNNLYLYSLTEDDKEERAEDEGADDEGAGDERPSTWRRGSWQQSRRFTWCSCDTMNYIIKTFDALGPGPLEHLTPFVCIAPGAISKLLILVEVSVKVACRSMTVTDWK